MFQQLLEEIIQILDENGGRIPYRTLYENTEFQKRALLPKALQHGKATGQLHQHVGRNPETGLLEHDIVKGERDG